MRFGPLTFNILFSENRDLKLDLRDLFENAITLSKMCIKGNKGVKINKSKNLINEIEYFFAEDQGRYIIEINPKDLKEVNKILDKNSNLKIFTTPNPLLF